MHCTTHSSAHHRQTIEQRTYYSLHRVTNLLYGIDQVPTINYKQKVVKRIPQHGKIIKKQIINMQKYVIKQLIIDCIKNIRTL